MIIDSFENNFLKIYYFYYFFEFLFFFNIFLFRLKTSEFCKIIAVSAPKPKEGGSFWKFWRKIKNTNNKHEKKDETEIQNKTNPTQFQQPLIHSGKLHLRTTQTQSKQKHWARKNQRKNGKNWMPICVLWHLWLILFLMKFWNTPNMVWEVKQKVKEREGERERRKKKKKKNRLRCINNSKNKKRFNSIPSFIIAIAQRNFFNQLGCY